MSDFAIKAESLGKKFSKTLKRMMFYGVQDIGKSVLGIESRSDELRRGEFWAVDDISFEIKKGESFGVIGPNGSGKTTLLKLLNGIFMPDKGSISVNGAVGALIQVGAGFHPMLTGRENIYVNGSILGMSKREIDKKFDAIVDFAEIGNFLSSPVKHYSSGMYVRLGFAIAVHSDPEILLVDEILAVGDREFSLKCYQKMYDISKSGVTIILVSHNEYVIRERTEKCLYLDNGGLKFFGSSEEGIGLYINDTLERKNIVDTAMDNKNRKNIKTKIINLKFYDKNDSEISFLESGESISMNIECAVREKMFNPIFAVNFYGDSGFKYCANSSYEGVDFQELNPGKYKIRITIPNLYLPMDSYLCSVVIAEDNPSNLIDWQDMVYTLVVGRAKNSRGAIKLPTEWNLESIV